MKKLFWGVFFIYLNFNINFNGHQVNLLPDFVGYILLLLGANEFAGKSAYFGRVKPFAIGMAVYSAAVWLGALFSVSLGGWPDLLLPLAAMAVSLYISRLLIGGVREMEKQEDDCWGGFILHNRWKLLLGIQAVSYLLNLVAKLGGNESLYAVAGLTSILCMLCIFIYLLAWYRTWTAYEKAGEKAPADTEQV